MPALEMESEPLPDHPVDAAPRRRGRRILLLALLCLAGLVLIFLLWPREGEAGSGFPMDIEWAGEAGYASMAEGQIVRLRLNGDRVETEVLASGL